MNDDNQDNSIDDILEEERRADQSPGIEPLENDGDTPSTPPNPDEQDTPPDHQLTDQDLDDHELYDEGLDESVGDNGPYNDEKIDKLDDEIIESAKENDNDEEWGERG